MVEDASRGKQQQQPDDEVSLVGRACMTIDLLTKPLKSGKAEIDAAPTMQKPQVQGMDLYSPPRSEPLILPVR